MGHTVRGALSAWLFLVILQTATDSRTSAPGRVGGLVDTVGGLIKRAFDPAVPAIADHSGAAAASSSATANPFAPTGPGQQAFSTTARPGMAGIN